MSATGCLGCKMQKLSTALLIIAAVIAVNGDETAQDDTKADLIAEESKYRSVNIDAPSQRVSAFAYGDLQNDGSYYQRIMRIKDYVKKLANVPYNAEVPRPYPDSMEDEVVEEKIKVVEKPVPDPVETRVPFAHEVKAREPVKVVKHVPVRTYQQTSVDDEVKSAPSQVGSVRGKTGFAGFQSRFDNNAC